MEDLNNDSKEKQRLIQRLREKASQGRSSLSAEEMENLIARITEENRNGVPVEHQMAIDFAMSSIDEPRSVMVLNLLEKRKEDAVLQLQTLIPQWRKKAEAEDFTDQTINQARETLKLLLVDASNYDDPNSEQDLENICDAVGAVLAAERFDARAFDEAVEPVKALLGFRRNDWSTEQRAEPAPTLH